MRSEGCNPSFGDTDRGVGNNLIQVDHSNLSQPVTFRTGSLRRVEREVVWCRFVVRNSGGGAHQLSTEVFHLARFVVQDQANAVPLFHGHVHRVFQPLVAGVINRQSVDNNFDKVIFVAIDPHIGFQLGHFSVDPGIEEAFLPDLLEQLAVMTFTPSHQGSHHQGASPGKTFADELQDLVVGIFHHFLACFVRKCFGGTGIQQAQEVVNLGHRPDCRARVAVGGFLFDRNHRAEAGDLVYIGAFHVTQKRTGIGRKRFDVAALPFGINGIECQRRFSASAQTGNHGELVTRNFYINILEVVHPGTMHHDLLFLINPFVLQIQHFCFLHIHQFVFVRNPSSGNLSVYVFPLALVR